jgi:hypothetical protein
MCSKNLRHLAKQRRATHLFLGAIRCVMRNSNYKPSSNSPLNNDTLRSYYSQMAWSGELHEQSDVQAQMALLSSIQHMSLAVEDAGRRPVAFLVLVRAALEASASAHFLSSPNIDSVAERARRGLNEMLSGCYHQWRALDQYGQSNDAAAKLELMNEWLDRASSYPSLGPVTRAHERRSPKAPYVGDQRPTISSLIDDLFPSEDGRRFGRMLYATVSAPSHTEAHGFAIAGAQVLHPDGTQTVNQEAQMSADRVARFAITCLTAIYHAMTSLFTRYGWPWDEIETRCNTALAAWQELLKD